MTSTTTGLNRAAGVARYALPSRWLHWIVAAIVLVMIPFGLVMANVVPQGALQDTMFGLHESTGAVLLILMVLRLAARVAYGAPPADPTLGPTERKASQAAHHTLYLLLFVTPLLGWLGVNAYGYPVSVFGLFDLPTLLSKDEALSTRLTQFHLAAALAIAAIAVLHIGAALHHRYVRRDAILRRISIG